MENSSFKIIALSENKISNQNVLIAILSPITLNHRDENQIDYSFNSLKEYVFVFPLNSPLSQQMIDFPNEMILFNINDFKIKRINFEEIDNEFGYLHKDFINFIATKNSDDEIVKKSIEECILYHHVEMFFTGIFLHVLNKEYFEKDILSEQINKEEANDFYQKVIAMILNEICKVIDTDIYNEIHSELKKIIVDDYKDVANYGGDYRKSISHYIINNIKALDVSLNILKDKKYLFENYIKNVVTSGYSIAKQRMKFNLYNKDYFGHELCLSEEFTVLKIFPTPYAYFELNNTIALLNSGDFNKILDSYLIQFKLYRVKDESLIKSLKTKFIFQHSEILGLFYYKKRIVNDSVNLHGKQDVNPYKAFLNQGQINLTLKNDY